MKKTLVAFQTPPFGERGVSIGYFLDTDSRTITEFWRSRVHRGVPLGKIRQWAKEGIIASDGEWFEETTYQTLLWESMNR